MSPQLYDGGSALSFLCWGYSGFNNVRRSASETDNLIRDTIQPPLFPNEGGQESVPSLGTSPLVLRWKCLYQQSNCVTKIT